MAFDGLKKLFGGQPTPPRTSNADRARTAAPDTAASEKKSTTPRVSLFEDDEFSSGEVTRYGAHEVRNGKVVTNDGSMFANAKPSKHRYP